MGKYTKLRDRTIAGNSDANIEFLELCTLLVRLGFRERVQGSHHILSRENVSEIVNIQPKDAKAKSYQVKQIRGVIVRYRLGEADVD